MTLVYVHFNCRCVNMCAWVSVCLLDWQNRMLVGALVYVNAQMLLHVCICALCCVSLNLFALPTAGTGWLQGKLELFESNYVN